MKTAAELLVFAVVAIVVGAGLWKRLERHGQGAQRLAVACAVLAFVAAACLAVLTG